MKVSETVIAATLARLDALSDALDDTAKELKSHSHKVVQRTGFDVSDISNEVLRAQKKFRERCAELALIDEGTTNG